MKEIILIQNVIVSLGSYGFLPHGNRLHQCFCLPLYRVIHIPITYPQHLLPLASPAHTCKHIVNSIDAHPSNIKDQLEKHTQKSHAVYSYLQGTVHA